jgi:putative N6-adenine-specific DNA methylase
LPTYFMTASAGTEDLLADELRALGVTSLRQVRGGVRFQGETSTALEACLWSRVGMRLLLPLGSFDANDAEQLYEGARRIPWNDHLGPRHTLAVDATGTSEQLRHTHFIGQRIKDAVCDVIRERHGSRPSVDPREPDLRIVAHLSRGRCDLSLDLAGEPLFKRGYRKEPTRASLKETLAAAVLLAAGYDGSRPLHDPMCGSGTLAIEAALIAKNRAPGLNRAFGVERWPSFGPADRKLLGDLRVKAREAERPELPRIVGSDRDPEAIVAARANVHFAKVPVELFEKDAREIDPLVPPGFVVTNPPYGERLDGGGRKQLKTFFWQLGQRWRTFEHHRIAVLAGGPEFESAFGLRPLHRRRLYNGPIECELLAYEPRGRPA